MSIRSNLGAAAALLLLSSAVCADGINGGARSVDLTPYAKITDVPTAAPTIPPADLSAGGVVGAVTNQFRRPDAQAPRITRSKVIALNASTGVGTFDYSGMPFSGIDPTCPTDPTKCPTAIVTPLYTLSSGIPKCWATGAATSTSVSVKCQIENTALINLSIVTSGLTLNAMPSAGTYANVVVLPPSQ